MHTSSCDDEPTPSYPKRLKRKSHGPTVKIGKESSLNKEYSSTFLRLVLPFALFASLLPGYSGPYSLREIAADAKPSLKSKSRSGKRVA